MSFCRSARSYTTAYLSCLICVSLHPHLLAAEPSPPVPSFRNDVIPVLTKAGCNSGACHGALAGKNGFKLSLRGYDPEADHRVLTRQALARRIAKSAPAHSLILMKPTLTIPHGGGKRFNVDSEEYRILANWIAAGAPPPGGNDPVIEGIAVAPSAVLVESPGEPVQLSVKARYSDGSEKDVTRWSKFSSSNETIASVDQQGLVNNSGHGEVAISVWYSSKVSFSRVTVPHANDTDLSTLRNAPRNNFIDDLVLQKLEKLNIGPSPLCSDSEFIRRLYLDTMGVLPTLEELDRFLADPGADKRQRLAEEVFQRSEFVDYWSYQWSDVLLVSSRKLTRNAMYSYYKWIRDSVAENKPWDRFAYELVTATGNTLKNGATNYWVIHKDPIDITENLSQSFLGISLTCARCHNHPLEQWTQDQYYGMANLVSRVGLKSGSVPGEITVLSAHRGEIHHPRRSEPMPPQPLHGSPISFDSAKDRRVHLAEWLTSSENSHFARTIVNRVWAHFMGRGLVDPVDDLRATNPSSNEELFAALTDDFTEHGFDIQHLMGRILNSATYQLSSEVNKTNSEDNKYYSHYLIRRLPGEVILDALSQITGVWEEFEGYPSGMRALQLPDTAVRSYFLDSFGRPARITGGSDERMNDSNVAQVLHLVNGETLNRKLRQEDNIVDRLLDSRNSTPRLLDRIYKMSLGRPPTAEESNRLISAIGEPDRMDLEDTLWAVLTSKEFLFNH